jgi:hypothetical protein
MLETIQATPKPGTSRTTSREHVLRTVRHYESRIEIGRSKLKFMIGQSGSNSRSDEVSQRQTAKRSNALTSRWIGAAG